METNNIQSNIKKYFYSGVGFAAHSSDIIKGAVDEFVKQGKLSEKDGQKIVGEAIKKLEARYSDATQKVSKYASDEIAMLRKKIEGLEKKIGGKSPAASKAIQAVKKAVGGQTAVKKAAKKAASVVKKATKKAPAKKAAVKKAPAKKAAAKKAPAKKVAEKKAA